jgi:hypothetical protein
MNGALATPADSHLSKLGPSAMHLKTGCDEPRALVDRRRVGSYSLHDVVRLKG